MLAGPTTWIFMMIMNTEKYDDDIIIESEDPKEGDEEDPNEENPEEENLRGEDSNNDSKEGSSTGPNINP